jgi:Tfp pilus assembly protein PilE
MTRNARSGTCLRRQRGFTLVVGMIMLVLMTLLAISAFQASNVNLRIAGNMQVRQETLAAAQTAIEKALSSSAFTKTAIPMAASTVDLNGASYTVDFTPAPACTSVIDIPSEDLDPSVPDEFACIPSAALLSSGSGLYLAGPPLPASYCANTRWSLTAHVADANTGAKTTVEQGVAVRVSKADALTVCP